MRVTNNMIVDRMINTLNQNLERMDRLQNQLSTGKKISMPSDDPIIASRALKFRTDIAEIGQFKKNVDDASSWADVTESTLGSTGDVLQRARELAVQASTGTSSNQSDAAVSQEAQQLYQELIRLSNTSYAGRFIFSGYKTDETLVLQEDESFTYTNSPVLSGGGPPLNTFRLRQDNIATVTNITGSIGAGAPAAFNIVAGPPAASGDVQVDIATGQLTFFPADVASGLTNLTASYNLDRLAGDYNPDSYSYINTTQITPMQGENIRYDIGIGDKINVNVIGTNVFGGVGAGTNAGVNLANFKKFVDALNTGNKAGIQQAISDVDTFLNDVLQQRADIGARSNRLDITQKRLSDDNTTYTNLMSKNEDVDIAEVIMNLQNEQNVYKASLGTAGKIIQLTLVDFLR